MRLATHGLVGYEFKNGVDVVKLVDQFDLLVDCMMVVKEIKNRLLEEVEVIHVGRKWVSDEEPEAPEAAPQSPGQAPPSSDYVPGSKHPPLPDYVPGLEYPEYVVPSDDETLRRIQRMTLRRILLTILLMTRMRKRPLRVDDDEEDNEHLALANSSTAPIDDPFPSAEEIEPFKTEESAPTPPSPRLQRARIPVRPQTPMVATTEALIAAAEADVPPQKRLCLTAPAP
nr:hypothetical protein [Tanacetum cinerariifolium]